jgi:hypothetical protein
MVLSLESDFDDFHGSYDETGFGDAGAEAGQEDAPVVRFAGFGIREEAFVEFKGGETDCHFGNDTGYDSWQTLALDWRIEIVEGRKARSGKRGWRRKRTSETLVEGENSFFFNDPGTDLDKVRRFYLLQH